jgi:dethiobiotin synthetase
MKGNVYFVSGIDTDAGKSYATAWLAKTMMENGESVITQKFIQTGNVGRSEDIELHRRIMGIGMQEVDREMLTMPEIFSYPASPLLASQIDHRSIDFAKMEAATATLCERYDTVLLEGAGGLMVPLKEDLLTIDYVAQRGYPMIFVTSGKLGSVNHTLLSFEAIRNRGIKLHAVAYNLFPHNDDMTISNDTKMYIKRYMERFFPDAKFIEVPIIVKGKE